MEHDVEGAPASLQAGWGAILGVMSEVGVLGLQGGRWGPRGRSRCRGGGGAGIKSGRSGRETRGEVGWARWSSSGAGIALACCRMMTGDEDFKFWCF